MSQQNLHLQTGELIINLITWIRNIRNKYNLPKTKFILYIDFPNKENFPLIIQLIRAEECIKKSNLGNLENIEYTLDGFFETDLFFEFTQIYGVKFYVPIESVNKVDKIMEINQEIERLELQISKCTEKLLNDNFIKKASQEKINEEQKKKLDFSCKIHELKLIKAQFEFGKQQYELCSKLGSQEQISWQLQYLREQTTQKELYSEGWLAEVYDENTKKEEIIALHDKFCV